ncbi:MAG: SH3 domain-containing protein, partial [Clostridia bacterium]|nr:SH3 domain-containing protein [Clostridia bacterium]
PYEAKKRNHTGFANAFRRLALPLAAVLVLAVLVAIPVTRNFIGRSFITLFDKEKRLTSGDLSQNDVLALTDQFDQKTGESLVQELNAKGMGVSGWEVLYASTDRILIRNFASLLVYSNGQLKKAADLEALGLNHIQGSVVTDLSVSPDGRYVIAGNEVHEGENAEEETGTYLLEAETGRYSKLSQQGPEYTAYAWSFNGEWLALAKKQGTDKIRLINCNSLEQKTLPIEETNIKTLFVSNSGKYAYDTGEKIFVQDNKWHGGSPQRPVYVDAQNSKMWFIDASGGLCSSRVGGDLIQITQLDRNGGSKLIAWRVIGSTFVFLLEGGDIGYVNLQNGDLMTFSLKNKIDTDYLPWCTVSDNGTLLIDRDGRAQILSKSGEYFYDYPAISGMALYMRLIDDEHMVSVKLLDEQNPKAGEFAIQEMAVQTGETTELYRTVGAPAESDTPTPTSQAAKTFLNRAFLSNTAKIYSKADASSPLVDELMQRLTEPNQSKEFNLYDEVVNGFVHVESDDGISGWVMESDFIYYDNYKNFSYEKDSIDLNGDGKPDKISISGGDNYTLQVNDSTIEGSGITVINQFRIVDIDPNDAYKEIVVEETGPSSDTMSSFYTYDGSQLHFMGKLEGLCGNSDAVKG